MRLFRRVASYALLVALVVGAGWLVWQRQAFGDWLVLRNYHAPTDVTRLADDTTMTTASRHFFYINKPLLQGRTTVNQHCTNKTEQSVVLGCYKGNRQGIFLYAVSDTRLHGVEQVTAAHEMLHQAYDRLRPSERKRIDRLVQDFYDQGTFDEDIHTQIEAYKKSEPNDLNDEMHSLFGTEVSSLPDELERYYARYFRDRSRVVAYNTAYQGEFAKRKAQVAGYDQQLAAMKTELTSKQHDLDVRQTAIHQKKAQLDHENSPEQIDVYNADVVAYNAMAQAYNEELAATKRLITEYNQLIEARNAIALQEQQLQQALDSRLTPVGGQ